MLARAALEAFGWARWLADRSIEVDTRVKRGRLYQLADGLQRKRFPAPEMNVKGNEIISRVREGAPAGWAVICNDRNLEVGGETAPAVKDLIAAVRTQDGGPTPAQLGRERGSSDPFPTAPERRVSAIPSARVFSARAMYPALRAVVKRDVDVALLGFGGARFLRTSASRKIGRSDVRSAWFRWASVAAALCLVVGCSSSGSPAGNGLAARLQRSVDEFLSSRLVPGASVAVIDDGKLISVASGFTDLEHERAVARDTQFRIASVTKLYLASLALRLVERDKLSLDEPIGVWPLALPPKLNFARELTLRQLLSHTSGIDQTFTRDEDRHRALTTADLLERIPPPVCRPSSCWSYADGNYVLVQLVLEAASAQPLTTLVRDELAEPLGLRHTVVVDAANVDTVLPSQYALVSNDEGEPLEPRRLFEQSLPRSSTLITSAAEAARFADALLAGDLLEAASLETMLDTSAMRDLPCPHGCPFDYGLGVFHYDIAGHELVGHDGSSGAIVVHDRARGVTIAIVSNGGEQDIGRFLGTVLTAVGADTRTSIR